MLGIARIEVRNNKPLNWNENIRQWSVKRLINERWVVRRLHWWRVLQPAEHALLKDLSKVGALKKKVGLKTIGENRIAIDLTEYLGRDRRSRGSDQTMMEKKKLVVVGIRWPRFIHFSP